VLVSAQIENCLYNIPTSFLDLVYFVGCGLSRLVWVNVQVALNLLQYAVT